LDATVTAPGIPNDYALSTACFGTRLNNVQDQILAAVGMGFRKVELGLCEAPPAMDGLEEVRRETGTEVVSLIAGCRDSLDRDLPATRLASLDEDTRERAVNSLRRHARLARQWLCPVVVVRGSSVEDAGLRQQARALEARAVEQGVGPELREEVGQFVQRVQKSGQKQLANLCRSLHELMNELPEISFALEPGRYIDDLLGFDAMGWVLDDLARYQLHYWHDVGRIHMREKQGLPSQERWLEAYGRRMLGIHLQDAAANETAMPVGLGEVDFRLVAEFTPKEALRVLELHQRHGRAEVLSSVQFLLDHGF
jgi:sugar phosphate isomerase/epimerase